MALHLLFDAVLLTVVAIYDWRTLGRIHRATLMGGTALIAVHSTRHLLAGTGAWAAIAGTLATL